MLNLHGEMLSCLRFDWCPTYDHEQGQHPFIDRTSWGLIQRTLIIWFWSSRMNMHSTGDLLTTSRWPSQRLPEGWMSGPGWVRRASLPRIPANKWSSLFGRGRTPPGRESPPRIQTISVSRIPGLPEGQDNEAEVKDQGVDLVDLPIPHDAEATWVGACLGDLSPFWKSLLGEGCAFQTLRDGVQLKWVDLPPPLTRHPVLFATRNCRQDHQQAVDSLLLKGAVETVDKPSSLGCYSPLFLVPKKTGDLRPVIDLSQLNHHLDIPHFKMETQASVRSAIRQGEWAVSVNIRDAYHHVPMSRAVHRYLRFKVNHCIYQFTCLPFSLATSLEFTKLLRPVVALLQLKGVRLRVYLDDWLIRASSPAQAQLHANLVIRVLQHLGCIINFDKSELQPSQTFDFIGMQFGTITHTVVPLPKMWVKVYNKLDRWRSRPWVTARDLHRRQRLFVLWDESVVDISRAHVSRCIVETIKEAYNRVELDLDPVPAYDVRVTSLSWAYLNQISNDTTYET